jgi:class 3 adenylate cyclase
MRSERIASLKVHRRELVDPAIAAHHGRIVKTTGDGILIEFASVIDAVGCAVAVQRAMLTRNAGIPEDRRIVFRVGINVGDIIIDEGDILGDGVNIAARLEGLCEPGGICISRTANDQIRGKLSLSFADLGEQTVKNISAPLACLASPLKTLKRCRKPSYRSCKRPWLQQLRRGNRSRLTTSGSSFAPRPTGCASLTHASVGDRRSSRPATG